MARRPFPWCVLPYAAQRHVDAIVRTLYRLCVSHRRLLEWTTASDAEARCPRRLPRSLRRDVGLRRNGRGGHGPAGDRGSAGLALGRADAAGVAGRAAPRLVDLATRLAGADAVAAERPRAASPALGPADLALFRDVRERARALAAAR